MIIMLNVRGKMLISPENGFLCLAYRESWGRNIQDVRGQSNMFS